MANENVKIIVQEVDETRARATGSSSDIVYVPGLAHNLISASATNKPILCTTVDDFERYFGTEPYILSENDVTGANAYCGANFMKLGDCDRSYVYAKELLNAGLSVLYENISPCENAFENFGHFLLAETTDLTAGTTSNVFNVDLESEKTETITFYMTGVPNYGVATLLLESDGEASAQFDGSVTCKDASKSVTINGSTTSIVLEWENQTLNHTRFEVKVKVMGTGSIRLALVEGSDLATMQVNTVSDRMTYFFTKLPDRIANLEDKNEYTVKYLTTGGYPSFLQTVSSALEEQKYKIATALLSCAANRNDAVALIDHQDNVNDPLWYSSSNNDPSVYEKANEFFRNAANTEFGAMFTPWGNYSCSTVEGVGVVALPASFGYLRCLAKAIKTSPNWLAMAGVTRGIVPGLVNLRTNKVLSNVIAENYQPKRGDYEMKNVVSVNAITNVKPYGLAIWGNRTLKPVGNDGTVATNFLNIRNMMSDIKKLSYNTAKALMFEQDSDTLWLNFKSGVTPLLEQLKSSNGISDYKIIKNTTKYNRQPLTRGEMAAVIKIFPQYAVEYFEITVVVADNDVAVS